MTIRPGAGLIAVLTTAAALLGLLWARPNRHEKSLPPRLVLTPAELPADGYAIATLDIYTAAIDPPTIAFDSPHSVRLERLNRTHDGWRARLRAGVTPGRISIQAEGSIAILTTTLEPGDTTGDGTPDFLRLDNREDQAAFRRWFTFLAEAQYFQQPAARPAEIVDCAALIRYAWREALRSHAGAWAAESHLPLVPSYDPVTRYQYPYTPLGASLFRVREGNFQRSDLDDGAFAQFADAQTLRRFNTHLLSRDLGRAMPGDLLFYRQESGDMPFHSMIYLGASQISQDGARYVVYHTGPNSGGPGEIRRLSLPELLRFPQPEWRPLDANRNFLGVYRWNILRETS